MSSSSSFRSLFASLNSLNVFITALLNFVSWDSSGLYLLRNITTGLVMFVEEQTFLVFHIASAFVLGPGHLELGCWLYILYEFLVPRGFSGSLVLFLLLFVCIFCYLILADFISGRKCLKFSFSYTWCGLVSGETGVIPIWWLPEVHSRAYHM